MDTLTFDTPSRRRDAKPVEVDLCGEQFTVNRPKDATLYFSQQLGADSVSDADRAMGLLQFVDGTLDPAQRKRFFDRIRDRHDPVDMQATMTMVTELLQRWQDWPADGQPDPVVVHPSPLPEPAEPVRIQHPALDVDVDAWRPKDIVLLFIAAALATTANEGQQAWAMGLFIDASLDPGQAMWISRRLRDQNDDLELDHLSEIAQALLEKWHPAPANREQRRAAAKAARNGA